MSFSRTLLLTLATSTVLAYPLASAQAEQNRKSRTIPSWYFSLGAGLSYVEDSYLTVQASPSFADGNLSFDEGYALTGAIGYRPRYTNSFWDNTRFEFELGLLDNQVASRTLNGSGTTVTELTDIQTKRMMANFYYDYDATKQIRPYIGAGAGFITAKIDKDEDTSIGYQGMLGISYIPSSFPITEFGFGYRYFKAQDFSFIENDSSGEHLEMEYDAHILEVNMRAYF